MFCKKNTVKNRLYVWRALLAFVAACVFLLAGYTHMSSTDMHKTQKTAAIAPDSELSPGEELLPESAAPDGADADEIESRSDLQAELEELHGIIASGDTVGTLLQVWLDPREIADLDDACRQVHPLRQIKIGQDYTVVTRGEAFLRFEYEIDADSRLVAERDNGMFKARLEAIEYDIQLHRVSGGISGNLFNSMADCGETPALAAALADVFAWEINFIRDLREGDSFALLVEKRYRNGEFKGYGKLLTAFFDNQNSRYEAFLFRNGAGHSQYYTREGQSLRRAFLKAPLSFTRISSGYSASRLHPVTMDWKAHPAIDYAAPSGTPVKTVGKGSVSFMGYSNSAGNYMTIDHLNGYQTMYLHLSGFARGLRKGSQVAQGQVVGFVGRTGYATGPHLDFRMKRAGKYINPLSISSPRDVPVAQADIAAFNELVNLCTAFLEERRELAEYRPEELNM